MTEHQIIREHILRASGLIEKKQLPCLTKLKESEWSEKFEGLMRNRLIVGAFRYGALGASDKPQFDRCGCIEHRSNTESQATGDVLLILLILPWSNSLKGFTRQNTSAL